MRYTGCFTTCAVAALALAAAIAPTPSSAVERAAGALKILRAGPAGRPSFVQPEPAKGLRRLATFQVAYQGFTPAARAAFQRAVDIWAQRLGSPVPITVSATFQPLSQGVLGSAGSSFVYRDFPGAPIPNTFYVDALANKRSGRQLDPSPDIVARFSSNFTNWHYGSGPAPAGRFDFTTVVLHELGHGLGFLGAGNVIGGAGSVRLNGVPIAYDRFTENRAGDSLLWRFPDYSPQLSAQLRGGNLFFDSRRVRAAHGGLRARIFAPSIFQGGSSYSHLDEATFPLGNPNSLMTPSLNPGETIRQPGPITAAIFATIGW